MNISKAMKTKKSKVWFLPLVLALVLCQPATGGELLVWLYNHDGDTIRYQGRGEQLHGRVKHIDAPEMAFPVQWREDESGMDRRLRLAGKRWGYQPYAGESRRHLEFLMIHYRPRIVERGKDKYGRTLVDLGDDLYIQRRMVLDGMAWAYGRKFKKEQEIAKRNGVGLWALPCQVNPAEWRKGKGCHGRTQSQEVGQASGGDATSRHRGWDLLGTWGGQGVLQLR